MTWYHKMTKKRWFWCFDADKDDDISLFITPSCQALPSVFHACVLAPKVKFVELWPLCLHRVTTTLLRQIKQPTVPLWCCMCSASQWLPGLICSIDERRQRWSESTVLNCDLEEEGAGKKMRVKLSLSEREEGLLQQWHHSLQRFPLLVSLVFPTGGSRRWVKWSVGHWLTFRAIKISHVKCFSQAADCLQGCNYVTWNIMLRRALFR